MTTLRTSRSGPPTLWPAASRRPCARCGEPAEGIAGGGLCAACSEVVERRAARLGRWVALASTLLVVGYLGLMLRTVGPAWRATGRAVATAAAVAWCLLTYTIVKRTAREWLK